MTRASSAVTATARASLAVATTVEARARLYRSLRSALDRPRGTRPPTPTSRPEGASAAARPSPSRRPRAGSRASADRQPRPAAREVEAPPRHDGHPSSYRPNIAVQPKPDPREDVERVWFTASASFAPRPQATVAGRSMERWRSDARTRGRGWQRSWT